MNPVTAIVTYIYNFFETISKNSEDTREEGNYYFPCLPLSTTNEDLSSSSRFLPLLFNWFICSYEADS